MSVLFRKIGSLAGKMAGSEDLTAGMMSSLDPKALARAINANGAFMTQLVANLDPKVIADSINRNPDFMTRLMKELDASAVAESVNKNQRFMTKMIENLNPNVFTRSMNVVFNKIRRATYRPGMSETEPEES